MDEFLPPTTEERDTVPNVPRCPQCDGATYAWDASGARRCTYCERVWPAEYLTRKPMDERDPHKPLRLGISTHGDLDGKWVRQKDYDSLRAELATSRERHAADARDLEAIRVTVRDESQRAHDAEVELDTLRAGVASWKAEEESWKAREAELLAEVERLRASDHVLVAATNQRIVEMRRWQSAAVERKVEIGHLREANAQLERQLDTIADSSRNLARLILQSSLYPGDYDIAKETNDVLAILKGLKRA